MQTMRSEADEHHIKVKGSLIQKSSPAKLEKEIRSKQEAPSKKKQDLQKKEIKEGQSRLLRVLTELSNSLSWTRLEASHLGLLSAAGDDDEANPPFEEGPSISLSPI